MGSSGQQLSGVCVGGVPKRGIFRDAARHVGPSKAAAATYSLELRRPRAFLRGSPIVWGSARRECPQPRLPLCLSAFAVPTMDLYSIYLIAALSVSVLVGSRSSSVGLKDLEARVNALQRGRREDGAALRKLQRQIRAFGSPSEKAVKESSPSPEPTFEFRRAPNVPSEMALFRREMLRLRERMDLLEGHRLVAPAAVRWLQEGVSDVRREMREMAAALNTSAALAERQRSESRLALMRSDMSVLGHRMERARGESERHDVGIQQLRQEMQEMRNRMQEGAEERGRMRLQFDSLKEEFRDQSLNYQKKIAIKEKHGSGSLFEKWIQKEEQQHGRFRHNHWKSELLKLDDIIKKLELQQTKLLESMREQQALSTLKMEEVKRSYSSFIQKRELELRVTNRRIAILESIVNQTQSQTLDIQSRINNITSSGIQKLHGSTMELFEALERLERNQDRTIADIRREISQLDSILSQTQSEMEKKPERHISSIRNNVQSKSQKKRFIGEPLLNREEVKFSDREAQIETLSNDGVAEQTLHRREMEAEWQNGISKFKRHQKTLEAQLEKVVEQLPSDCSFLGPQSSSGPYLMRAGSIQVFCDMETSGGGWLVFQRRHHGDQSFEQNWHSYKLGFGDEERGDFWLGNELLHEMTAAEDYALRIDLWDAVGLYRFAEYRSFRILDESENFRLLLSGYRGNASNAFSYHNGMAFSTPDRDNDASEATHCARFYGSGWWYNHCQYVNINGRFNTGMTWYNIEGQEWNEFIKVEMKIKPQKLVYL